MRILMTGATGLVGQGVLKEILATTGVDRVGVLGRHPIQHPDPRVEDLQVASFDALEDVHANLAPWDACFYCAGAPPLGFAEAAYRHVTLDLTLHVARTFADLNPSGRFLYVSGAHANPNSRIMQMRVKGDTESALHALPITAVMLRPGGIQPVHGERSSHALLRRVYALGGPLMGLGVRFLPSVMTTTAAVGRSMLQLARMPDPPTAVDNLEINELGGA